MAEATHSGAHTADVGAATARPESAATRVSAVYRPGTVRERGWLWLSPATGTGTPGRTGRDGDEVSAGDTDDSAGGADV